jgi:hypothetical protein
MSEIRRNLHQFLKVKQLYGMYTVVPRDLMSVLKDSAAKGEAAKPNITEPPSNEEFHEQRRRKRKPLCNSNKRTKKPAASTMRVNGPQLRSKDEVPTQKFFAP